MPRSVFLPSVCASLTSAEMRRWNCSERQFFNNADQAPQAAANDREHFECNLRMLDAEGMEVVTGDKCNFGIFNCECGSRIRASVEDRQFRNGFSGTIERKNLLAAADRRLEDANFAAGDDVQPVTRIAFRKQELPRAE